MVQEYAVWIGRVQPFHVGHLQILQRSLQTQDQLHVNAIVCHDYDRAVEDPPGKHAGRYNPFTPWERHFMIRTCLASLSLESRVTTIFIPFFKKSEWGNSRRYLPEKFVMCTTNKDVEDLTKVQTWNSLGWASTVIDVKDLDVVSSSHIRSAVLAGQDWKEFIHESLHSYFQSIDGPSRLLQSAVSVLGHEPRTIRRKRTS